MRVGFSLQLIVIILHKKAPAALTLTASLFSSFAPWKSSCKHDFWLSLASVRRQLTFKRKIGCHGWHPKFLSFVYFLEELFCDNDYFRSLLVERTRASSIAINLIAKTIRMAHTIGKTALIPKTLSSGL